MAENRPKKRRVLGLALLVLAEAAVAGIGTMAAIASGHPAGARRAISIPGKPPAPQSAAGTVPAMEPATVESAAAMGRRSAVPRSSSSRLSSSRAPAPRRPEGTPSVNVVVFGDSMAEWLAYGLEEAFAETPEIGINRKPRPNTGLIRVEQRGEAYDWPAVGARNPDRREAGLCRDDARHRRPPRHPRGDPPARASARRAEAGCRSGKAAAGRTGRAARAGAAPANRRQPRSRRRRLADARRSRRHRGRARHRAGAALDRGAGRRCRRNGRARVPFGGVGRTLRQARR